MSAMGPLKGGGRLVGDFFCRLLARHRQKLFCRCCNLEAITPWKPVRSIRNVSVLVDDRGREARYDADPINRGAHLMQYCIAFDRLPYPSGSGLPILSILSFGPVALQIRLPRPFQTAGMLMPPSGRPKILHSNHGVPQIFRPLVPFASNDQVTSDDHTTHAPMRACCQAAPATCRRLIIVHNLTRFVSWSRSNGAAHKQQPLGLWLRNRHIQLPASTCGDRSPRHCQNTPGACLALFVLAQSPLPGHLPAASCAGITMSSWLAP